MTTTSSAPTNAILSWSAGQTLEKIAAGDISAREVTEAYLRRIQQVNPLINAIVFPMFEQARAAAAAVDAARKRGETLGPLAGLPMTVKESFNLAGTPTTAGLVTRRESPGQGGCLSCRSAAGGRGRRARQDERAAILAVQRFAKPALWSDEESVEPRAFRGRFERRRSGRDCGGVLAIGVGERYRWQPATAGERLRHLLAQADVGPPDDGGAFRPAARPGGHSGPARADGPLRPRPRPLVPLSVHARAVCRRLVHPACAVRDKRARRREAAPRRVLHR